MAHPLGKMFRTEALVVVVARVVDREDALQHFGGTQPVIYRQFTILF